MQNRLRNVTITEANRTALGHFLSETKTWSLLGPIDTAVVEPQNEFAGARAPTVPDDSEVQMPVKHDFSEIFAREIFFWLR